MSNQVTMKMYALRELAEKATPGPWVWDGPVWGYDAENEAPWLIQKQGSGVVITGELQCSEANAEYIAAASPEVITALLDENEALQAECEKMRKDVVGLPVAWVTADTVDGQAVNGKPRRIWWENNEGVGIPIYTAPQSVDGSSTKAALKAAGDRLEREILTVPLPEPTAFRTALVVSGLVEALTALRGCIMETRGPDARSALELADAALDAYHKGEEVCHRGK